MRRSSQDEDAFSKQLLLGHVQFFFRSWKLILQHPKHACLEQNHTPTIPKLHTVQNDGPKHNGYIIQDKDQPDPTWFVHIQEYQAYDQHYPTSSTYIIIFYHPKWCIQFNKKTFNIPIRRSTNYSWPVGSRWHLHSGISSKVCPAWQRYREIGHGAHSVGIHLPHGAVPKCPKHPKHSKTVLGHPTSVIQCIIMYPYLFMVCVQRCLLLNKTQAGDALTRVPPHSNQWSRRLCELHFAPTARPPDALVQNPLQVVPPTS